ncbi:MAG: CDP-diacylglycerol--glycerol-3-phosphate 3-phosphatidyltransferase [Candidatus Omnitrophota bacterium]
MNVPNILTVSRIFLTLIFAMVTQASGVAAAWAALALFMAAALTDLADGYIARKYNLVTVFGQIMDPIADKLLILTAFFIFSFEGMMAVWMVVVVACREILVTVVRIYALTTGRVLPAESAGKWKSALQMTAASLALTFRLGVAGGPFAAYAREYHDTCQTAVSLVMFAAIALTLASGLVFFKNVFKRD